MPLDVDGLKIDGLTGILKGVSGTVDTAINSDLPVMSATVGGAVPTPPNNTTTFLRGDGTFAIPSAVGFTPVIPFLGNLVTCALNGTTPTTIGCVASRVDLVAFSPTYTFTSKAFNITVTVGVASAVARVLIYSNVSYKPEAKLYESASLDCSASGVKEEVVDFVFTAGTIYWVGVQYNSTQTIRALTTGSLPVLNTATNGNISCINRGSYAIGSAPASGFVSAIATGSAPLVIMKTT